MKDTHRTESGQAMILLVLGIVGLLGFAAMAIDGGRIYTDRRTMQNASDTSSMTGAGRFARYFGDNLILWKDFNCESGWFELAEPLAYSEAINRASQNGYAIDTNISDMNGVTAECVDDDTHVGFTDKYIDVFTYVTSETPSSFAQFVFGGPLIQTVETIARIRPQTSVGFGHAIVALNPAGCSGNSNGAQFNGDDTVYVNGGGVFANGCMGIGGTSLEIGVNNGSNTFIGELQVNGGPSVTPWPIPGDEPLPDDIFVIPAPDCSSLPNRSGDPTQPGVYPATNIVGSNTNVVMAPGLYCFTGTFRINGGTVTGTGVTIYIQSGDLDIGGDPTVNLSGPASFPDPSPALPNVVIYLAEGNTGEAALLGNSDSTYGGTVYAPDGTIEVGGTGGVNPTYSTQLIGWNVNIHGNAEIIINFDDTHAFQVPPRMDLQK